jgi:hypothetical protein
MPMFVKAYIYRAVVQQGGAHIFRRLHTKRWQACASRTIFL